MLLALIRYPSGITLPVASTQERGMFVVNGIPAVNEVG